MISNEWFRVIICIVGVLVVVGWLAWDDSD